MSVLRNSVRERYTVVNQKILTNKNLSMKERGMLATLLSLPDNWNFTAAGLCSILPDGQVSINTTLKSLEEKRYIKRRKLKNDKGRFYDVEWIIYEEPYDKTEPADNEVSPLSENPLMDSPFMDSWVQSNTNISNTNKSNTNLHEESKSYDEIVDGFTSDEKLRSAIGAYIQMRTMIHKPLSNYALKKLLRALKEMPGDKVAIVDNSITHNYLEFYPLRDTGDGGNFDTDEFFNLAVENAKKKYMPDAKP